MIKKECYNCELYVQIFNNLTKKYTLKYHCSAEEPTFNKNGSCKIYAQNKNTKEKKS